MGDAGQHDIGVTIKIAAKNISGMPCRFLKFAPRLVLALSHQYEALNLLFAFNHLPRIMTGRACTGCPGGNGGPD